MYFHFKGLKEKIFGENYVENMVRATRKQEKYA